MKKRDIDYDRADRLSEEYYAARRSIFYHANILKGNTPMKPLMNPRQGEDYFFHYFKILIFGRSVIGYRRSTPWLWERDRVRFMKHRDFAELYEVHQELNKMKSELWQLNPRMGGKYWRHLNSVRDLESLAIRIFERVR